MPTIKNRFTGTIILEIPETDDKLSLSGLNLSEADLAGWDLRGVDLSGTLLRGANLKGTDFSILYDTIADFDDLTKGDEADLTDSDLSGADLFGANLFGCNLTRTRFKGAICSNADFGGATLEDADLSEAVLDHAKMGALIMKSSFVKADLREADFRESVMAYIDFSYAQMNGVFLNSIDLRTCILTDAVIENCHINEDTLWPEDFMPVNYEVEPLPYERHTIEQLKSGYALTQSEEDVRRRIRSAFPDMKTVPNDIKLREIGDIRWNLIGDDERFQLLPVIMELLLYAKEYDVSSDLHADLLIYHLSIPDETSFESITDPSILLEKQFSLKNSLECFSTFTFEQSKVVDDWLDIMKSRSESLWLPEEELGDAIKYWRNRVTSLEAVSKKKQRR